MKRSRTPVQLECGCPFLGVMSFLEPARIPLLGTGGWPPQGNSQERLKSEGHSPDKKVRNG